jgi:hypothetical protein
MRTAFTLWVALGVAVVAPAAADPVDKARVRTFDQQKFHHRAKLTNAAALAPLGALTFTRRPGNTDGLSRDSEDCNYGCIDH